MFKINKNIYCSDLNIKKHVLYSVNIYNQLFIKILDFSIIHGGHTNIKLK